MYANFLTEARAALAEHVLPPWCQSAGLAVVLHLAQESPSNNTIKGLHFQAYKKLRNDYAREIKSALGDVPPPGLPLSALFLVRRCVGTLNWGQRHWRFETNLRLPCAAIGPQPVRARDCY
jgi:hypothetical protein